MYKSHEKINTYFTIDINSVNTMYVLSSYLGSVELNFEDEYLICYDLIFKCNNNYIIVCSLHW